jgi:hypothetical protein
VPSDGSTSTLFFQDATGKRNLRLDHGYNVKTRTIDYHWNQKGTFEALGIADHTPVGQAGEVAYNAAKYFRYAGRVLLGPKSCGRLERLGIHQEDCSSSMMAVS